MQCISQRPAGRQWPSQGNDGRLTGSFMGSTSQRARPAEGDRQGIPHKLSECHTGWRTVQHQASPWGHERIPCPGDRTPPCSPASPVGHQEPSVPCGPRILNAHQPPEHRTARVHSSAFHLGVQSYQEHGDVPPRPVLSPWGLKPFPWV